MINKKIAVDSTVLLRNTEGVADSRILTGFRSLIEAEAVTRARNSGYEIRESYCRAGEFAVDLIGETSLRTQTLPDGSYLPEGVKGVLSGEFTALISLDTNGFPRRAAASAGLVNMKPTYGTVSRYGAVPVASSSDTVTVTAQTAEECRSLLTAISGCDEKDPTALSDTLCPLRNGAAHKPIQRVGVPRRLVKGASLETRREYTELLSALSGNGVEIVEIPQDKCDIFSTAHAVWNVVLCSEAWGNTSRYDGVRYGRRAESYENLSDLYIKSRSEGLGALMKSIILYGSYALSPDSDGRFFKADGVRKTLKQETAELFKTVDAILIPACSVPFYTEDNIKTRGFTAFNENIYTALPSLCGLPTLTVRGVQIIGAPLSDTALLDLGSHLDGHSSS